MLFRKPARQILFILLTAVVALTSCNMGATPAPTIDVNAISTAAFSTAVAQISVGQTQTAIAAPSATPSSTNTSAPQASVVAPGAGTILPTATLGTPATISFNSNNTPLAGFTPLGTSVVTGPTASLGDACNNNVFVADITIEDGTVFRDENKKGGRPGDDFQKVWRVQNTGNCKWDEGYQLAFVGGDDALDPHSVKFESADDFVDPGETVDLSVFLVAPKFPGKYQATWRMKDDSGDFFGSPLTVIIEVEE